MIEKIEVKQVKVSDWSKLQDRQPIHALVANVDLVIIRHDDQVAVFYGRCLHRRALLADGHSEIRIYSKRSF
jgi:methylamine---glutamate N-methyltransferase subunit C